MTTTYQYWNHKRSGETYAVGIENNKVVEACGPLHYSDVQEYKPEEYEWDYELAEDINGDQESYSMKE